MKVAIRILASLITLEVLSALLSVMFLAANARGAMKALSDMPFHILTSVFLAVVLVLGPISVWQLWRGNSKGRIAAQVLLGVGTFYYFLGFVSIELGWLTVQNDIPRVGAVGMLTFNAAALSFMLLPAVRSFCDRR